MTKETETTVEKINASTAKSLRGLAVTMANAAVGTDKAKESLAEVKQQLAVSARANAEAIRKMYLKFCEGSSGFGLTKTQIKDQVISDFDGKSGYRSLFRETYEAANPEAFATKTASGNTTNGAQSVNTSCNHYLKVATAIAAGVLVDPQSELTSLRQAYSKANKLAVPGFEKPSEKQADANADNASDGTETRIHAPSVDFGKLDKAIAHDLRFAIGVFTGDDSYCTDLDVALAATDNGAKCLSDAVRSTLKTLRKQYEEDQAKAA